MMRKLFSVMVAVALLAALCIPVFAAQTATMTVTASQTTVKPGDKVTFKVSVTQVKDATMGGFRFVFDEAVFEYVGGESLPALNDFMAGVSTAANKIAGFFMSGKETVEGELFSVTLKVKEDAKTGTYTVTGKPSISAGDKIECGVKEVAVTVADGKTTPTETTQPAATEPDTKPTEISDAVTPKDPQSGDSDEISVTVPVHTAPTYADNDGDKAPEPAFPWWIIAVVVAVAVAGGTFLIIEFRKTKAKK